MNAIRIPIPASNGAAAVAVKPSEPAKARRPRIAPVLWTIEQLAEATSIGVATLHELTRRGDLPSILIGSKIRRYSPAAINDWIAEGCPAGGYEREQARKREEKQNR